MTISRVFLTLLAGAYLTLSPALAEETSKDDFLMDTPEVAAADAAATSEETAPRSFETPMMFGLDVQYVSRKYDKFNYINEGSVVSSDQPIAFRVNFEWLPKQLQRYGKPGVGLSAGFSFLSKVDIQDGASGTADLSVIPLGLYVVYHADFIKNQILVPFAKVGYTIGVTKLTSNSASAATGTSTYRGIDYGFGLELCLNPLEPSAARGMDQNFGINTSYLVFEYIVSSNETAGKQPDLSGSEYRAGLRFEL